MSDMNMIIERLDRIDERLDRFDAQLTPITDTAESLVELKNDITPQLNATVRILIEQLIDVETEFEFEDLLQLIKRSILSVRDLIFSLEHLDSLIDFIKTSEPLFRITIPQIINYLDDLEQKGVFRTYSAMLGVRGKAAKSYTPEEFETIGDAFVSLLGLLKAIGRPETLSLIQKLTLIPSELNLAECKDVGPIGMMTSLSKPEAREGLGVLIELTKALGKLK